jgi:hypothetical protein
MDLSFLGNINWEVVAQLTYASGSRAFWPHRHFCFSGSQRRPLTSLVVIRLECEFRLTVNIKDFEVNVGAQARPY